jgi:hypothetical protein
VIRRRAEDRRLPEETFLPVTEYGFLMIYFIDSNRPEETPGARLRALLSAPGIVEMLGARGLFEFGNCRCFDVKHGPRVCR